MKIIKIGAVWCPACLVMNKVFRKIPNIEELDIITLDYDMDNLEVSKYDVGKILPVIIFLDNEGMELERVIGEIKEDKLMEIIDRYREGE